MATDVRKKILTPEEFEALFNGDIDALHKLAGAEGKLVLREDGTIEVVPVPPGRESSNG